MTVLDDICRAKRAQVQQEKAEKSLDAMMEEALCAPSPRGFQAAILAQSTKNQMALIAEIKKASPSKGLIRNSFTPALHAKNYSKSGATCISVLTDTHFDGTNSHFMEARAATTLPLLRKDFMLEPWQIYQSRVMGADCVLLILAILDDRAAMQLYEAATRCKMDILVEIHDEAELTRALALPDDCMVGINNRNLHDFSTNLDTSAALLNKIPISRITVSESGISCAKDVSFVQSHGANAVLVGETLMRQNNLSLAVKSLMDL